MAYKKNGLWIKKAMKYPKNKSPVSGYVVMLGDKVKSPFYKRKFRAEIFMRKNKK